MSKAPITTEEIKEFRIRIETSFVWSDSEAGLYGELNLNYEGWTLLRAPTWIGPSLVALVVRPRSVG